MCIPLRQGTARVFGDVPKFMDEPTSNLDSLNEGIILKSLRENSKNKTVILVSHRESTMAAAEKIYHMKKGRQS